MSPSTSSRAFDNSTIDAEAPCELFTKVKPDAGTLVLASKLVVIECRTALCLNRRFIVLQVEEMLLDGAMIECNLRSVA